MEIVDAGRIQFVAGRVPLGYVDASSAGQSPLRCAGHLAVRLPHNYAMRVLIVDDNKDAASSLGRLLSALGKETRVAHDGLGALATLAEFRPEVAFLDLGMPGMDGFETAVRFRAQPEGKQCILIALTGWGDKEDRRRTHEAGFAAHLVKPVKVDELEATLQSLLANRPPH